MLTGGIAIRIQKWKVVGLFGFPFRRATPGEMARHFLGGADGGR